MFCNQCGKTNPDDAHLCGYCGASLTGSPATRRLVRRRDQKVIAGVAAGVANYFGWNVTAVRALAGAVAVRGHRRIAVPHPVDRDAS